MAHNNGPHRDLEIDEDDILDMELRLDNSINEENQPNRGAAPNNPNVGHQPPRNAAIINPVPRPAPAAEQDQDMPEGNEEAGNVRGLARYHHEERVRGERVHRGHYQRRLRAMRSQFNAQARVVDLLYQLSNPYRGRNRRGRRAEERCWRIVDDSPK